MVDIEEEASRIVEGYANKRWQKALDRVEKERQGKGCGCLSCQRGAVEEINDWTDFITFNSACLLHYSYDDKTRKINRPDVAKDPNEK